MLGETLTRTGKMVALAAIASTGLLAGSASADRIVGTTAVYANPDGQSVAASGVSNYTVVDNGDSFFVNVANVLTSARTRLTGVFLESGLASLVDGLPAISFNEKGGASGVTPSASFSAAAPGSDPISADSIAWGGSAVSVTSAVGLDNQHRMLLTFDYADGVDFDDVSAVIGGFGYRIATLVEDIGTGAVFASTSGAFGSDGGTIDGDGPSAVPTPTAVAGGLGLLALAGMRRRNEA